MEMHWALLFTLVLKAIGAPTSHDKRQHIIYEAKDVRNTWAESRPARNTDTIDNEETTDCEKLECPELYEPVCGTDGLTHHNKCKLKIISCYKPQDNLTIDHLGECIRDKESYIRNNKLITDGNEIMDDEAMLDSDGCWYHVLSEVIPYGTIGYEKCTQIECQQDKDWHPTGERLPNCDVGSVKCWNWVTNETASLESTMDYKCNTYLCTEEDWELSGISCEGCLSATTGEYMPHGFNGYWKCDQFECLKNNTWQETGERLPGCSVGEVKCWDWNQDAAVPIGSKMIHNDIKFVCTDDEWQQIDIQVTSSPDSDGCWYNLLSEVVPYGTKVYKKCTQMQCQQDKDWHPTGEKLPNCDVGSVKCWNWVSNVMASLESTMDFGCNQYLCTEEDWELSGERISCEGCLSATTGEYMPHGFNGYWKCEQFECLINNTWQETGERLPGCSVGEVKCWDWNQDAAVPISSKMIHNDIKFVCTDNEWQQIDIQVTSSPDHDGCWYNVLSKVMPYGTKGYKKCTQMQCQQDNDWHPTGERLPNCDVGSVKCWNWVTNETASLESTMDFECNQYLCTEEDWELSGERISCEGCLSETTGEYLPHGFNGYWKCDQIECLKNNTWQETGERLPGCPVGEVMCWDWNQDAAVPIGSKMIHNDIKFVCTDDEWQQINIHASSSPEGCISTITDEVEPYGTKGYYRCEQYECLKNKTWHETGEKLPGCSLDEMKCLHWYNNDIVPLASVMFHNCTQYICTDFDWEKTPTVDIQCLEDEGCLHPQIQNKRFPIGFKGYYKCDSMECKSDKTWHSTGERLLDCANDEVKCWDWKVEAAVPINSKLIHNSIQYECTEEDWTPLSELAADEPEMIYKEERFDTPCNPGVTSERDGQQCCCSEDLKLDCNGPCSDILVTASPQISPCTPGQNITNEEGQVCCCNSEGNLDCTGPCTEPETKTMMDMETTMMDMETTMMDMETTTMMDMETSTMMDMETTTEKSSSTKKYISLSLFLLSAALFCI